MINLSPDRRAEDLIDALYEARRADRRDLEAEVVQLLNHEEPIVREEAVSLLMSKWKTSRLAEVARELLRSDPDYGVRARAAIGLASISGGSNRKTDAALLASVFGDANSTQELKRACFEALSLMAGRPTYVELDDTDMSQVAALVKEISSK